MSKPMFELWKGEKVTVTGRFPLSMQLEPVKMLRNVGELHFEDPGGDAISAALQSDLKAAATYANVT